MNIAESRKEISMVTFKDILNNMNEVYERKNADYGDSFSKTYAEFGLTSAAVRINDKNERFKTLIKQEAQVKDESIEDTLLDLANYTVLTLMELMNKDGK